MKKLTALFTLSLILIFGGFAQADEFQARGSAIVTGMMTRYVDLTNGYSSTLAITNITGSPVKVRVTFYDHDGNDVTSYCSIFSGSSVDNSPQLVAAGTGLFDLPAASTRYANLAIHDTSRFIYGHAVIEWASTDPHLRKALISSGLTSTRIQSIPTRYYRPVNGGQPF